MLWNFILVGNSMIKYLFIIIIIIISDAEIAYNIGYVSVIGKLHKPFFVYLIF